jgi:hypothetical protein
MPKSVFKTITVKTQVKNKSISQIYQEIHNPELQVSVKVRNNTRVKIVCWETKKEKVIDVDKWILANSVEELDDEDIYYSGKIILLTGPQIYLPMIDTKDNLKKVLRRLSERNL